MHRLDRHQRSTAPPDPTTDEWCSPLVRAAILTFAALLAIFKLGSSLDGVMGG